MEFRVNFFLVKMWMLVDCSLLIIQTENKQSCKNSLRAYHERFKGAAFCKGIVSIGPFHNLASASEVFWKSSRFIVFREEILCDAKEKTSDFSRRPPSLKALA